MTTSLLLDQSAWDLVLDANGNWALASQPYAIAQDVSCAVMTFLGECWYDTTQGVPYWQSILGQMPPLTYVSSVLEAVALTVPNVAAAKVIAVSLTNRLLEGQIQIVDTSGLVSLATFGAVSGSSVVTSPQHSTPGAWTTPPLPPADPADGLRVNGWQLLLAGAGKRLMPGL